MRKAAEADGWICQLCGEPIINSGLLTFDHSVPKSWGQPGANSIENCQVAHQSCNQCKGNKGPEFSLRGYVHMHSRNVSGP